MTLWGMVTDLAAVILIVILLKVLWWVFTS